jgi:hypothetical protein
LYFSFFSTSLCTTFLSAVIATSISMHILYYYYYYCVLLPLAGGEARLPSGAAASNGPFVHPPDD